jgi:hypothetical protein
MKRLAALVTAVLSITVISFFGAGRADAAQVTESYCTNAGGFQVCVGWNYTYPHAYGIYRNNNNNTMGKARIILNDHRSWSVGSNLNFVGHTQKALEKWGVPKSELCASVSEGPFTFILVCHKF